MVLRLLRSASLRDGPGPGPESVTAVFLGITDLHLLAQLLSLGLFAVPTALYHLALLRVKDDPVLLAALLAAIAVVFMTTSFFIVGEYNTAYAIGIVVAVRLVTAKELTVADGAVSGRGRLAGGPGL